MKKKAAIKVVKKKFKATKKKGVYTKTHSLPKVVSIHSRKIKKRGGTILSKEKSASGTTIKYKF